MILTALLLAWTGAAPTAHAGWWDGAAKGRETTLTAVSELRAGNPVGGLELDVPCVIDAFVRRTESASGVRYTLTTAPDSPSGLEVELRDGSLALGRAADVPADAACRVHVVVVDHDGVRRVRVLRVTRPRDALTPEEAGQRRRAEALLSAENPKAAADLADELLSRRAFADEDRLALLRLAARARRMDRDLAAARTALARVLELAPGDSAAAAEIAELETPAATAPPSAPLVTGRAVSTPPSPPPSMQAPPTAEGVAPPLPPLPPLPPVVEPVRRTPPPPLPPIPAPEPPVPPSREPDDVPPPPPLSDPR